MELTNDEKKSLLKLTQFRSFITDERTSIDKKAIELILRELDLNLKISTKILEENQNSLVIGNKLLHLAYEKKNIDVFNALISKGADFNAKDESGSTVLHKSFQAFTTLNDSLRHNKKKHLVDLINIEVLFLDSVLSAHVKYTNTKNPCDANGLSHFHIACTSGSTETVEFFLNNGVPVNQAVTSSRFEKYTPLHFTALYLWPNIAEILLKYGANVNLKNGQEKTPLHMCVERNINYLDSPGSYPEIISKNEAFLNLLLHNSADPEFPHLFAVSATQDSRQIENFLAQGVDLNQSISIDSKIWPGYTALHFAAHSNVNTVKLLIRHGANILAEANGLTPFDMCVERYKVEDIIEIINLVPTWKDIVLPDGETKVVDLLAAFGNIDAIKDFLDKTKSNVDLFKQPFNSCLWRNYTLLHLAVFFTERSKCKSNYLAQETGIFFQPDPTVITEILNQEADVTVASEWHGTPIHYAFRHGRMRTLNLLLEYHHRVTNCVNVENLSHLHIACVVGNQALVKKFLWNDADVNIVYKGNSAVSAIYTGWTPLHIAVSKGNFEMVKLLLEYGANPHAPDANNFTPIHNLIAHAHPLATQLGAILFSSSDPQNHESLGLSYLHVACWAKNVDAVKKLLDLGVDVHQVYTHNVEACNGGTPLHFLLDNLIRSASRKSKFAESEIVRLMMERGADILVENSVGLSPLIMILKSEEYVHCIDPVVDALRGKYSLRRRIEDETGLTLLHLACRLVDVELIKKLLDDGVNVNARIPEKSMVGPGFTALHVLIGTYKRPRVRSMDNFEVIVSTTELLLNRNADVTLANAAGSTVLHIAYQMFDDEPDDSTLTLVNTVLKAQNNFEINPKSATGISHFHIACHLLNVDAVKNFLENDVDVNSVINVFHDDSDFAGCTPLLFAIKLVYMTHSDSTFSSTDSFAQLEVVSLLIEHGADVNVEDVSRNTPLHYAAMSCSQKDNLLQLLIKNGANVNAKNVLGETPLELLLKNANSKVEEIRYFTGAGCRFNAFNPVTNVGYIGLATSAISHEKLQNLLYGTFVNFPDSIKVDDMNLTTIHNLVSVNASARDDIEHVDLFDVCARFGCDIDDQDFLGRTPLHLAAQFRNESAVAGLLLSGANIDITDRDGKTPFAYVFEPCCRCRTNDKNHDQYGHVGLFKKFVVHIEKLKCYLPDFYWPHELLFATACARFEGISIGFPEIPPVIVEMMRLPIKPHEITLRDFILGSGVIDYPTMSLSKRQAIDDFFRSCKNHFHESFIIEATGIFRLQYRQAVLRRKIINEAKDSLIVLMKFRLPDVCSGIILKFLKNSDLQNIILSTHDI